MIETQLPKPWEKMNLFISIRLLRLIMDRIAAKNDIVLKDVRHANSYGLIRGLKFSNLVFQLIGLGLIVHGIVWAPWVLSANPDPNNDDNISHNSKHCWPCDCATLNPFSEIRNGSEVFPLTDGAWNLVDGAAKERTAQAYPCVSDHEIDQFHSQIQQVLMARGLTTFSKIVNK
ncbi:hypothetical protein PSTG_07703 [Puccinia striiformis f. sp. tritici PST-78]|uniref:RNA recognition motif spliceosomal PrP8 domain-containing protein n=1 Tax=Puccinia striiformis f. sp. tritici PST-78 TaxID=1165861 RepID=A0A0L0VIM1_9BASI|nr:hypothetical protein PSTG_07703 [Puccinia striiformis f. sp. tritici PST-78]